MALPTFLVVGPPRTGTTWLYNVLRTVPSVYLPDIKQLHYFDKNYERGVEWYQSFFIKAKVGDRIGEITPDYVTNGDALRYIAETLPGVKLVMIYREPIERAVSHYRVRARNGVYNGMGFSDVFEVDKFLEVNSRYGNHLTKLLELFPVDDLLILDYDSLNRDPRRGIDEVLDFIDVSAPRISGYMLSRRYSESLSGSRWQLFDEAMVVIANKLSKWGGWVLRLTGLEEVMRAKYRKIRKINSNADVQDDFILTDKAYKRIESDIQLFLNRVKDAGVRFWREE